MIRDSQRSGDASFALLILITAAPFVLLAIALTLAVLERKCD